MFSRREISENGGQQINNAKQTLLITVPPHSHHYCTKSTISSADVTCDIVEEMGQLFKVGCDP